jgi:hypothetical protein
MNMDVTINEFCRVYKACSDGSKWAVDNCSSMQEAWDKLTTENPMWKLWVASRPGVLTQQEVRDVLRWLVEHALKFRSWEEPLFKQAIQLSKGSLDPPTQELVRLRRDLRELMDDFDQRAAKADADLWDTDNLDDQEALEQAKLALEDAEDRRTITNAVLGLVDYSYDHLLRGLDSVLDANDGVFGDKNLLPIAAQWLQENCRPSFDCGRLAAALEVAAFGGMWIE